MSVCTCFKATTRSLWDIHVHRSKPWVSSGPGQDVTVWETLVHLICEAVKLLGGPGKKVEQ